MKWPFCVSPSPLIFALALGLVFSLKAIKITSMNQQPASLYSNPLSNAPDSFDRGEHYTKKTHKTICYTLCVGWSAPVWPFHATCPNTPISTCVLQYADHICKNFHIDQHLSAMYFDLTVCTTGTTQPTTKETSNQFKCSPSCQARQYWKPASGG